MSKDKLLSMPTCVLTSLELRPTEKGGLMKVYTYGKSAVTSRAELEISRATKGKLKTSRGRMKS